MERDRAQGEDRGGGHAVPEAALGYLYQSELALYELVRRARRGSPDVGVSIELLDDVTFDQEGTPKEILQVKHHLNRQKSLSDASADLWKTLKAWIDLSNAGEFQLPSISLSLVTTSSAPPDGAAAHLRAGTERDVGAAVIRLDRVANTSTAAENQAAYSEYLRLDAGAREDLLASVYVFDASPNVRDLPGKIANEIFWMAEERFLGPIVERLLGWWHREIVKHLMSRDRVPLKAESLFLEIKDLREAFISDSLPIDVTIGDAESLDLDLEDRVFVRQLLLIAMSSRSIELAIRDYKRAFMQRSRWLRDQLVESRELERYENNLVDEWDHYFAIMQTQPLGSEDERTLAGSGLYERMLGTDTFIREKVHDRFIPRGSLHMLADDLRVGWHPDFVERLKGLLAPTKQ